MAGSTVTLPTPTGTTGVHTSGTTAFDINLMLDEKLMFQELERVAKETPLLYAVGLTTLNKQMLIQNNQWKNSGTKVIGMDFANPTTTITDDSDLSLPTKEQVKVNTKEIKLDKILKTNQTFLKVKWDLEKVGNFLDKVATSRAEKLTEYVVSQIKTGATAQKVKGKTITDNFINAWQEQIEANSQPGNLVYVASPAGYAGIIKDARFVSYGASRIDKLNVIGSSFIAGSFMGVDVLVEPSLGKEADLAAFLIDRSMLFTGVVYDDVITLPPGYSGDLQTSMTFIDYLGVQSWDDFKSIVKVSLTVTA